MVYYVIEGIDGSGKTTIANKLIELFKKKTHYRVKKIIEPTTIEVKNKVNEILKPSTNPCNSKELKEKEIALLFAMDRLKNVPIIKNTSKYDIVIGDRSMYSSMANQSYYGTNMQWLKFINIYMPRPDRTFWLDRGMDNILEHVEGKDLYEHVDYIKSAYKFYNELERTYPDVIRIDANDTVTNVTLKIFKEINKYLRSE